ncbi:MAG: ATP synthase F1 subunit delta, partial [Cyanobacteria bacterium DS2.3.42]|nr:ATP synthase F1 subunit delta [Cyanobacteria bacterium DS2.3.42]
VSASLVSSEKLSDEAVANIKARLTEHLGKRLELEVKVDPSLIGGVVLRLGDQVIDGSLKGQLKAIEKALMAV